MTDPDEELGFTISSTRDLRFSGLMLDVTTPAVTTFTSAATGMWDTDGTWDQSGAPAAVNPVNVQGGHTVTVDDDGAADAGKSLVIAGGSTTQLNGILGIAEGVTVDSGGILGVAGTLNAATLDSAGTTTFASGSGGTIGTVNVTNGTTSMATPTITTELNVTGGTTNLDAAATIPEVNISGTGTLNVNAAVAAPLVNVLTDGTLNLKNANLTTTTMEVSGGTVNTNHTGANAVVVSDTLTLGDATFSIDTGSFTASGADLLDPTAGQHRTMTLSGGTMDVSTGADPYRYYRFDLNKVRDSGDANSVQLSELQVFLDGGQVTGATASNPDGDSPPGEGPDQAVDNDTDTKWLDFTEEAATLILDFGSATAIDQYWFATANDADERDPVRWTFEGSYDNSTWDVLHNQTGSDYPTPTARYTFISKIDVTMPTSGLIDMPNTDITVAASSSLNADTTTTATFGNLDVAGGTTLSLAGAPGFSFKNVSLGGGARIGGGRAVAIGGELDVGASPGTSYVEGDLTMKSTSTYVWELGEAGYDQLVIEGSTSTLATEDGWTLRLVAFDDMADVSTDLYIIAFDEANFTGDWYAPIVDTSEVDGNPLWTTGGVTVDHDAGGVYITGLLVEPANSSVIKIAGDDFTDPADTDSKAWSHDFGALGDIQKGAKIHVDVALTETDPGSDATTYDGTASSGVVASTNLDGAAIALDDDGTNTGWVGLDTSSTGPLAVADGTLTIDNMGNASDAAAVFTLSGTGTVVDSALDEIMVIGVVQEGDSYAGIKSQSGGGFGTGLELLGGSNDNSAKEVITTKWRARTTDEENLLISDVVDLDGIDGDTFVLQMSYDQDTLWRLCGFTSEPEEEAFAAGGWIYIVLNLGTYESPNWVHPGTHPGPIIGGWDAKGGPMDMGKWGVDTENNLAWLVTNHNSEFAVTPEPGTLGLLALGAIGILMRRRRRI